MVSGTRSDRELRELLRAADDPLHAESPPDFEEREARAKLMRLIQLIVGRFGRSVGYEAGFPLIQDASFFADVTIPAEATKGGVAIGVRTSNFCELATIFLPDADLWDDASAAAVLIQEEDLRAIEDLLAQGGYDYVPLRLLVAEYDGVHRGLRDTYAHEGRQLSWWQRYFDWL